MVSASIDQSLGEMASGTHAVLIYDTQDHKRDVLLQHIKHGVGREGLVYAYADESPNAIEAEMARRGIGPEELIARGELTIQDSKDVYLKGGAVDVKGVVEGFSELAWKYKEKGLGGVRAAADMSPMLREKKTKELMDYELALTTKFDFPGKGVCAYNLVELYNSGSLDYMMKIFMAHSLVILSGPSGYAIREPELAKREGLLSALHSRFPDADLRQKEGQGFRPASLR
ncbi:MAG: MEDS domain-containing protein [Nitrososphaerota archaeon]|nr:MEDS domain-containing protein [Nitrososphaerota archaeon]